MEHLIEIRKELASLREKFVQQLHAYYADTAEDSQALAIDTATNIQHEIDHKEIEEMETIRAFELANTIDNNKWDLVRKHVEAAAKALKS